jgi:hypothetical protein
MVGAQHTGNVPGVVITTDTSEGLRVVANGQPARLAVVDEHGYVIASGDDVEREVEAVVINGYRAFQQLQGSLKVREQADQGARVTAVVVPCLRRECF